MGKPIRVGINGLGIMGRYLIRAIEREKQAGISDRQEVAVVAANDLFPPEQLAPLLAHDSVYGAFPGLVEAKDKIIMISGEKIDMSSESEPAKLNWADRGVDVVYESTGVWAKKEGVEGHLGAGAKKVVYSAPSEFAQKTIVMGVNHDMYKGEDIVSNASCTTNCLAPVAFVLYNKFGEYEGLMTTIHAYTADQNLVDAPHKDLARAFTAGLNFIPTSTGAAKAIGKVIPGLDGKLNGIAIRGPVAVGSIVDLVANLGIGVTAEGVNNIMQEAAEGYLEGVLEYREGPVVSSMTLGRAAPSMFDAKQTMVVGDGLVKVLSHYDNVSGYSHQAIKLIKLVGGE